MNAQPLSELTDRLSNDAAHRLSRMMDDVEKGKDEDIRTPLLNSLSDTEILDRFTDEVFNKESHLLNETLTTIEAAQKSKFGPRSIQKPWDERKTEPLTSFEIPDKPYPYGPDEVLTGSGNLRPCSTTTSKNSMKRSTNSGLPELVSKRTIIDRESENNDGYDWPCVMFTRTQEGGKTRTVWGYPYACLLREGMYFLPIFEQLKEVQYFSAYKGPDHVDLAISELLYTKGAKDETIYCEDFERFDQTITQELVLTAFAIIQSYFQNGTQILDDIFEISQKFLNIGIATPDGVYEGTHGIPSGSWFTSVVGSLVHLCAQYAVENNLDSTRNQVMGDDGVIVLPKSISKKDLSDVYASLNLEFNEEKTFESDAEVIYLQRYYGDDYTVNGIHRGIYPVYRALNRLIHMERWTSIEEIEGSDYFAIRAISILENCKWHPMHKELVKWVAKSDKYNLSYSQDSLKLYISKFQEKTVTTVQNQYSDNVSGMNAFETVKILKQL